MKDTGVEPEDLEEREIWYGLDTFPKKGSDTKVFRQNKNADHG